MSTRTVRATLFLAVVASIAPTAPASAADGAGCRLTAVARITPGLGLAPTGARNVTLSGNLSMCGPGVASGTVSTGNVWTDPATGYSWREPAGTGTGGCSALQTNLITIVRWNDGTVTVVNTETASALNAVTVRGSVLASALLVAENAQPGQAETYTVTTNRFGGGSQGGMLVAAPADNGVSCGGAGLVNVPLDGAVTIGTAA